MEQMMPALLEAGKLKRMFSDILVAAPSCGQ